MNAEIFVDTNILFYAITDHPDPRHVLAREKVRWLWEEPGRAAISVQVLQELHVNLVRKAGMSDSESANRVQQYLAWRVVDNDRTLLSVSFEVQTTWKLSYWDSLIVAAAWRSGASVLWTEDLQDGLQIGSLRIENPLRA